MKKFICFFLSVLLILCLCACDPSEILDTQLQSVAKVEQMMEALSQNRPEAAQALMHPSAARDKEAGIAAMIDFLDGRQVVELTQTSMNVRNTTGTSGKARQEQVTFRVVLDDGTIIHVASTFLSNAAGAGFQAFQLTLGVV